MICVVCVMFELSGKFVFLVVHICGFQYINQKCEILIKRVWLIAKTPHNAYFLSFTRLFLFSWWYLLYTGLKQKKLKLKLTSADKKAKKALKLQSVSSKTVRDGGAEGNESEADEEENEVCVL